MSEKIIVPTLGESVTEATVSKWLKVVGDKVDSDEPLVELETDKVNVEVPSPSEGILEKIDVKEGQVVEVGALLGIVSEKTTGATVKKEKKYIPPVKEKEDPVIYDEPIKEIKIKDESSNSNGLKPLLLDEAENEEALILKEEFKVEKTKKTNQIRMVAPSARKMAKEKNINLDEVEGSGKRGTILKGDIISLMGSKPSPNKRKLTHGEEERIKMTRLRLTIAKRLKEAQNNAAMLTTFNEVDMFEITEMRKKYQEEFQKNYGIKLGFMSFFVKASVAALKNFPVLNA